MKANELRIGNWVEIKPKTGNYTTIQDSSFSVDIEKNYAPIVLDEKWLKDFGFKWCDNTGVYYKGTFELEIINDNILFMLPFEEEVHIVYVHQLQNLYQSLKELDLKIRKKPTQE